MDIGLIDLTPVLGLFLGEVASPPVASLSLRSTDSLLMRFVVEIL